jgi:hypothetical protein
MSENVSKKFLDFLKPKDDFYYVSKDFQSVLKGKYHLESPSTYENQKKVFLLCAYEWYTDRRNVKDKINKHPYFPNIVEHKFRFRFNCFLITLSYMIFKFSTRFKLNNYFRLIVLYSSYGLLAIIYFFNLHDKDFSPFRKFYYRKIKKLKESNYEKLDISEQDVINQLRNYNIKVVYQY